MVGFITPGGDEPLDPVARFRMALYTAFGRRRDALFDLVDALLTAGRPPSLVHLCLAPVHRRGWGSLYAALRRGQVDADAVRALLLNQPRFPGPPVFAVDVSVWPRRDAETSPERAFHSSSPCRRTGSAIVRGWAYQWIAQLSPGRDSWTAPVDVRRVRPGEQATWLAVEQVRAVVAQLPPAEGPPLFVFDAWYDAAHVAVALADTPAALLIRLRSNRCFSADLEPGPNPPPRKRRRNGATFVCNDPATWPTPTAALSREDALYGHVDARAWAGLHRNVRKPPPAGRYRPRLPAHGTILRVQVARLPGHQRTPEPLWLWYQGPRGQNVPTAPELEHLWRSYCRRYDLEQTFRFLKQTLGWVTPRVQLPEQADRWTWLVVAASTQLRLVRGAVADRRLPWERPLPLARLTPGRVQRSFVTLAGLLPPLAASPRPCGHSPGRPKGRHSAPAARYPPVKQAA